MFDVIRLAAEFILFVSDLLLITWCYLIETLRVTLCGKCFNRFDRYPLSPLSLKAINDAGYETMTVVQEATLPIILKGICLFVRFSLD